MPRHKRSEEARQAVAVQAAPTPRPTTTKRAVSALCPVCGRTIHKDRAIKVGYVTVDTIPFFESIEWDRDKPFGVSRVIAGRGSFHDWEHISPEDEPELFQAVKRRFLDALEEWLDKHWLSPEEVSSRMKVRR